MPRLAHYPAAPFTSGPDFTELYRSATGGALDPWQSWVLDVGLGEREDGKWASFQNTVVVSRQNGKDEIFVALGLGWLFLTGERLIGHSAHEYKTAMEAFRRLVGIIENCDDLRRKVKKIINTNGEEGIELLDGRRMRFLARSKGAGRGFSFDKMIWNEAYALVAAQVDAVLPTMSARPNPQLWLGSSPPLDAATGEALFRARRAAEDKAPGVMMVDWGLAARLDKLGPCADAACSHRVTEVGCVLDSAEMHARTNPAYPHRINAEAIARERATMDPIGFARERLGAWPPDLSEGYTVISRSQWEALEDTHSGSEQWQDKDWPHPATPIADLAKMLPPTQLTGKPCFAVAMSSRTQGPVRTSIGVAQRRQDGKAHLELVLSGPGSAWVPAVLAKLQNGDPTRVVVIDPGSPAGSIIADVEAAGVTVTTMSTRDVAQAFGMIYDAATSENPEDRNVAHLGQSELVLAVRGAGTRPVGDGTAWDVKNAGTDITPIDSVTKALWGLATKGHEAAWEPLVMYA
jgi:hypothetical protein